MRGFVVRVLPATDNKPVRIRVKLPGQGSIIVPWSLMEDRSRTQKNARFSSHVESVCAEAVLEFCKRRKLEWGTKLVVAWFPKEFIFVFLGENCCKVSFK
jgi:hypothetical protein